MLLQTVVMALALHAQCTEPSLPAPAEENGTVLARREKPERNQPCQPADSSIANAMRLIERASLPRVVRARPWNGRDARGLADLKRRFGLGEADLKLLKQNGFVVPERLAFPGYGYAFHEIYQSEVPVFVSADSIFHAIYASNDAVIKRTEKKILEPLLASLLAELHCALPQAPYPAEVKADLDLYLTVARSLLHEGPVKSSTGIDRQAAAITALAVEAGPMRELELFGRKRVIDFSQYQPRGHYGDMAGFFRAVIWLSRLEFNMVSRSSRSSHPGTIRDPSETPREASAAVHLADLLRRTSQTDRLRKIDGLWRSLAGPREDLSPLEILELAGTIDEGAPARLKERIGTRFRRQLRMHYMPPGSAELPVITTLLGPGITADAQAFMPVVHPEIPARYMAGGLDAAHILGSDRSLVYLGSDLRTFPSLRTQLDRARLPMQLPDDRSLYAKWLGAVRALHAPLPAARPAFMRSEAYQDFRLNSVTAAYAQIKHNYVLMAAQPYDEGGCEIPYGYVEPSVSAYRALSAYLKAGEEALRKTQAEEEITGYFARAHRILAVITRIAEWETQERELPREALQFLSMVTEMSPGGTGGPPTYTGWYFDLFFDRNDALRDPSLIADFYTSVNEAKVSYAGVNGTRMGVFMVDTGGEPRAVAGPVARSFLAAGPADKRYTDDDAGTVAHDRPWASSYTTPAPSEPPVALDYEATPGAPMVLHVQSPVSIVTVELLDHHRRPLKRFVLRNPGKKTEIRDALNGTEKVGAVHIESGEFHLWAPVSWLSFRAASQTWREEEAQ